ncbi:MAG: sugar phosphate nucleotidyltransferase [Planctomycetota bacterium]|jgi:dTDP-glucose pyrophosphorylase
MRKLLIEKSVFVKEAMECMGKGANKILFVIEDGDRLFGTLTDGDIRRHILDGGGFDENIADICNQNPLYVYSGYQIDNVRRILLKNRIECVPVLNRDRRIIDILSWADVFDHDGEPQRAKLNIPVVIMAGGKGERLDPFTKVLPKPLVPIGSKPIIELVIERFLEHGIEKFYLSVNHKSKIIKAYFSQWERNYQIYWIEEDKPLGTAGSLKLLDGKISGPFFVSNCDIIAYIDYAEIFDYHQKKGNDITLVASTKQYNIPYGICEIENEGTLMQINEKPEYNFLVNIGLYLVNDTALKCIPCGRQYDFLEFISAVKQNQGKVGVFTINEDSWFDVGEWKEYRKTMKVLEDIKE